MYSQFMMHGQKNIKSLDRRLRKHQSLSRQEFEAKHYLISNENRILTVPLLAQLPKLLFKR